MEEQPTVSFKGSDYLVSDLSYTAKHLVSQLQDLQNQATQLKAKMEQVDMASAGFAHQLEQELDPAVG